jgi:palmitoyl-protein thioesterase
MGAYQSWIQAFVVQAQYWHDPTREEKYKEKSVFLADINNEKEVKNARLKISLFMRRTRGFISVLTATRRTSRS